MPLAHAQPAVVVVVDAVEAPAAIVPVAIIIVVVAPELLFPLLRLALLAGVELVAFPVHSQF